jgi:hypothetical protein
MAEKQSVAGLGARPRKQLNALDNFTLVEKPEFKQKSLNEILADLSAAELEQLQKYGRMILNLSSPYSGSYYQQINRIYKNLDRGKQLLLAELLQQIQPRENTGGPEAQEMAARKLQADYMDRMIKETAPKAKAKGPDLAGKRVNINALVNTFLKDVEKSKAKMNSGRFDAYSRPNSEIDPFLEKLALAESSGDTEAEINIKDGRSFVGKFQFGSARVADFKQASGERFTMKDFKADADLHDRVAAWHVTDIDEAIDAIGDKANSYDRDGLRAVAHLGGKAGMRKYLQSRGEYNPSDELGTSLQDYYDKFSSAS